MSDTTARMHEDAKAIFQAGIRAVIALDAIHRHCRCEDQQLQIGQLSYDLTTFERVWVVGAGKATAAMARAMEELIKGRIHDGLISVKYDHTVPLERIRAIEAGHPLPDANGMEAANEIMKMVQQAGANDLVIVLISGGGSALLPLPAEKISLKDKQKTSDLLLACGATIHEMNTIRKHISAIKGGRLAQAVAPAQLITLILSDVVGDDLDVIASGPTVPDTSSFQDCLEIVDRYAIGQQLPGSVLQHLQAGGAGQQEETPKSDTHRWDHVQNQIIGNNFGAIQAASREADRRGYQPLALSSRIEGETRVVAQVHGAIAREVLATGRPIPPPACILSGGETTVTLKGNGLGGRNQEFALAAALDIADNAHIVVLSGGTDGTDGPTDAAGAITDHATLQRANHAGLDLRDHLDRNDAYPFFNRLHDLVITGPTGTNVMDLHIVLVRPPHSKTNNSKTP